jgi:hypothetical protein
MPLPVAALAVPAAIGAAGSIGSAIAGRKAGEKGYGSYKQSKLGAKQYMTAPGTTMGVGSFMDPNITGGQDYLTQTLMGQMQGMAPSPAQMMLQGGLEDIRGQIASNIAGSSGSNQAFAQRQGMQQASTAGTEMARQMGILRAQEQEAARQQFLALLAQRLQGSLGLEGVAAQNYATAMGSQRGANIPGQTQAANIGNMFQGLGTMATGIGALAAGGGGGGGGGVPSMTSLPSSMQSINVPIPGA